MKQRQSQKGQGLTEYAVILSVVAVAAIAGMALFGGALKARVASLSGAVAGQREADIEASDKVSKKAAKEAQNQAKKVDGTTTVDGADIFDSKSF